MSNSVIEAQEEFNRCSKITIGNYYIKTQELFDLLDFNYKREKLLGDTLFNCLMLGEIKYNDYTKN